MSISLQNINNLIDQDVQRFILECDVQYYKSLQTVVDTIISVQPQKPIILLSGPSGASKTTTALMIEGILDNLSITTHSLSLDNYFISFTKEQVELALNGKIDLESPCRLDIPFLNDQLIKMINGESVALPKYDFKKDQRILTNRILTRKPNDIVIIEGTHALNPDVISIPREKVFKIYVDVQQSVIFDNCTLRPPMIRLVRRMIRDKRYRNRSVQKTFEMFTKVETGEKKYIQPYKKYANCILDTFIPYELSVYKKFLESDFDLLDNTLHLHNIVKILNQLHPISIDKIHPKSIVREFTGDSGFSYQ